MSQNLEMKIKGYLKENSEEILMKKLKSYNLGKEFNYAVVVLKVLILDSEKEHQNELAVKIVPKVQYVTPFITKALADEYCKELSTIDKLKMLFVVEDGRIVVKDEDVKYIVNNDDIYNLNNSEFDEKIPYMGYLNIIAACWDNQTKEYKDDTCYKLGGFKNYNIIKEMFDNWKF